MELKLPYDHSLKLSDLLTIFAMIASATWFVSSAQSDSQAKMTDSQAKMTEALNELSQNVRILSMEVDHLRTSQGNFMTREQLALWVEKLRQAEDFSSIPPIPLKSN